MQIIRPRHVVTDWTGHLFLLLSSCSFLTKTMTVGDEAYFDPPLFSPKLFWAIHSGRW